MLVFCLDFFCAYTYMRVEQFRFFLVGKKRPARFFPEVVLGRTVSKLLFLFIISCCYAPTLQLYMLSCLLYVVVSVS